VRTGRLQVYTEVDRAAESRQFSCVETPADVFLAVSAESHLLEYTRLPMTDDAAPAETARATHFITAPTLSCFNLFVLRLKNGTKPLSLS